MFYSPVNPGRFNLVRNGRGKGVFGQLYHAQVVARGEGVLETLHARCELLEGLRQGRLVIRVLRLADQVVQGVDEVAQVSLRVDLAFCLVDAVDQFSQLVGVQ